MRSLLVSLDNIFPKIRPIHNFRFIETILLPFRFIGKALVSFLIKTEINEYTVNDPSHVLYTLRRISRLDFITSRLPRVSILIEMRFHHREFPSFRSYLPLFFHLFILNLCF